MVFFFPSSRLHSNKIASAVFHTFYSENKAFAVSDTEQTNSTQTRILLYETRSDLGSFSSAPRLHCYSSPVQSARSPGPEDFSVQLQQFGDSDFCSTDELWSSLWCTSLRRRQGPAVKVYHPPELSNPFWDRAAGEMGDKGTSYLLKEQQCLERCRTGILQVSEYRPCVYIWVSGSIVRVPA